MTNVQYLTAKTPARMDPTSYQLAVLGGLQAKPVFMGVDDDAGLNRVSRRRAKNRVARKSRRTNRKA